MKILFDMDYMTLDYLRRGGREDNRQLIEDFKQYMRARGRKRKSYMRDNYYEDDYNMDYYDDPHSRHNWYGGYMRSKESMYDSMDHFNEQEAKELVAEMYHTELGRKHTGEKFSLRKAEEICEKYKDQFVFKPTPEDIYVAINATYHDLHSLFKSWFGSNTDDKIILTAITFWFKDEDYQGNKILHYFE